MFNYVDISEMASKELKGENWDNLGSKQSW